jgi:hypothetical protein
MLSKNRKGEMMKKILILIAMIGIASGGQAAVTTAITQSPGAGTNVNLTAAPNLGWGYATNSLVSSPVFDNTQTNGLVPASAGESGLSSSSKDYGWTFTFIDGTSPATATAAASDGNAAGPADGEHWDITFTNIVSSTETRRVTLYLGGYANTPGGDRVDVTVSSTLTGGSSDETGVDRTISAQDGTVDDITKICTGVYTVDFSSATETDLVLQGLISNCSGGRNVAVCGYRIQTVLSQPTGLVATPSNNAALLDWDDNTDGALFDSYTVYRSTNSGSYASALETDLTSSDYVDTTAANGTTYYYVVAAVDTNGVESALSAEASVLPFNPSNLAPVFNDDPIVEPNAEVGTAYSSTIADHASDPDSGPNPLTFSLVSAQDWLFVASDGGLSGTPEPGDAGTNTFTVAVSDGATNDTTTLQITVDPDTTAPAAPTGLSAAADGDVVRLDWDDNTEPDLDVYNVYRSTTSGSYGATPVASVTRSVYVDRDAPLGTEVFYVVKASDGSLESSAGNETNATPTSIGTNLLEVTFGSANDGLAGFTQSSTNSPNFWTDPIPSNSVEFTTAEAGLVNNSLLKETVLPDREFGAAYRIEGIISWAAEADRNNRQGIYLFGNVADLGVEPIEFVEDGVTNTIPDSEKETGALGLNWNSDDEDIVFNTIGIGDGADPKNISSSFVPQENSVYDEEVTFRADIVFTNTAGTNQIVVTYTMFNQFGGTLGSDTITKALVKDDYKGDYFGFAGRTRQDGGTDSVANYKYFRIVQTAESSGGGLDDYEQWLQDNGLPTDTAEDADSDDDGVKDLFEFATGGDPDDDTITGTAPVLTELGGSYIYTYGKDSTVTIIDYTVETTTNLLDSGSWTNSGTALLGDDGGSPITLVSNSVDTVTDEKFIRLKVERNDQ